MNRENDPSVRLLRSPAPLLILVALLIGAACSTGASNGAGTGAAGEQAAAIATHEAEPFVPDAIPDPGVEPGTCEIVTYTPSTAREAQIGELCRPATDQRDVAVVLVHGGSGIGGAFQGMKNWADRLSAEGYVTFSVDYHLFEPGSGSQAVFPQPEQNIKAAAQFLRGTANAIGIQRDRVVVQGFSAGARLAAVAFTTPDDPYFAGPELWPDISDEVNGLIGFYHPYDGSMQYSAQYYGGPDSSTDPDVSQRWDKADSLGNATDATGPALFVSGSEDWSLIDEHQDKFAQALQLDGEAAETVIIEGGSHGFDDAGARLSKRGEESATKVLVWLNTEFPQSPGRDAQTGTVDLASAPERTGEAPVSFDTRTRPSKSESVAPQTTTTTWRAAANPTTTTTTWQAPATTTTTWQAPVTTTTAPPPPTTTPSTTPTTTPPDTPDDATP